MSVVIDEVVQENPADAMPDGHPQQVHQSPQAGTEQPDLDRLAFEYRRRHHRLERLWAD